MKTRIQPRYLGLKKKTYLTLLFLIAVIFIILIVGRAFRVQELLTLKLQNKSEVYAKEIQTLTIKPEELSEHDQIEYYIKEVFGKDSGKAFLLLSCENKGLNPNARNVNTDGSVDHSIFQINSYWQQTQGKFLDNWKVNVLIAKQIYDESNSFKMWSCGKRFGI